MTRTHSEKQKGRWIPTYSAAACDDCGKEDSQHHIGRVTAPLPHGWTATLRDSGSGKSQKLHYNCGCAATA